MANDMLVEFELLNDEMKFNLSNKELKILTDYGQKYLDSVSKVHNMDECLPAAKYKAQNIHGPLTEENKLNAWYYKCTMMGNESGILQGKTITIKDNICVAGVPMMCGSKLVEGFKPHKNASVIGRVLDEGGHIVGKATCNDLCRGGASYPSATGHVLNPHNIQYSAGGSSSGCAALIANGEVDMAIGADQAGSIRGPASNCGIVGMKPTFGLVPYTGALSLEQTLDHIGPMANNVANCAALLQAIAGHDNHSDPRQGPYPFVVPNYIKAIANAKQQKFKLGILKEGFDMCVPEVAQVCRAAVSKLGALEQNFSATHDISVPMHLHGNSIARAVAASGTANQLNHPIGWLYTDLVEAVQNGFERKASHASILVKLYMMNSKYINQKYGMIHYSKAQRLALNLRREYDRILDQYDVIMMPTVTQLPCRIPASDTPSEEYIRHTTNMFQNTCPFNITHHPAISINVGTSRLGLPIGLQIVGKNWQDDKVLAVASLVEHCLNQ